jgi:hypothetical protein
MRTVLALALLVVAGSATRAQQPIPVDPNLHTPPRVVTKGRPALAELLVTTQVVVGTDGTVSNARIMNARIRPEGQPSSPAYVADLRKLGLDQQVLDAIKQWAFEPARDRDGRPVPVTVTIETSLTIGPRN